MWNVSPYVTSQIKILSVQGKKNWDQNVCSCKNSRPSSMGQKHSLYVVDRRLYWKMTKLCWTCLQKISCPKLVSFDMYMSYGWGSTGENVTSERHTTWRDRALHDVTSDMSHERQDFVTWLLHANAHPALRISQYDNSHPVRCFWILLEFRNTTVHVRSRVIRDMIIEL